MNAAITASPTTAPLRLNSRCSARWAGLSSSSDATGRAPTTASVMSSSPQPRVDEDIGDVGDQVERDVDRRRGQHYALHHGVVTVEHGVDDELAESWNGENLLGQHGAREQ